MDEDDLGVGIEDTDAPICSCGVTMLPTDHAPTGSTAFVCENPDCEATIDGASDLRSIMRA